VIGNFILVFVFISSLLVNLVQAEDRAITASIERGRYLVRIGACNDCHTLGWAESGGKIPEKDWLTGVPIGWRGPWGTTYAINIRRLVSSIDESQWITFARNLKSRPPMPADAILAMSDQDLKALYAFARSLGDDNRVMPAYVPPGQEPKTEYFNFTPVKN